MKMYIGLDVHCKETVYVAQDEAGQVTAQGKVLSTAEGFGELVETVDAPEGTKIGLETGTQAMWVARLLSGLGMKPVVIDAREVRQKARRIGQKCDRRDAFEICDGLRRGIYTSIVYVPEAKVLRLRRILSRRRHFVKICTTEINAAKFVLRSVGLQEQAASLTTWEAWQRLLRCPGVKALRKYLEMHADVWRVAREKVVRLEKELGEALKPFQETARRLQTIPGVGPITAATYIAVLATPHRFADSGRVVSYIGLVPSSFDTGKMQRHGHITKRGSGELRAMLCEAAHHAAQRRHPLSPYWARVFAKQGYKRAVIAVAQRLARMLFAMWRKGEDFDVNQLNVIADRRATRKTRYWRLRTPQEREVAA
jgi:transposase